MDGKKVDGKKRGRKTSNAVSIYIVLSVSYTALTRQQREHRNVQRRGRGRTGALQRVTVVGEKTI